jgi:hypothetical protein
MHCRQVSWREGLIDVAQVIFIADCAAVEHIMG